MILAIETSTEVCSAALVSGGEVVACLEDHEGEHARKLGVYIDELLRQAGSINAVAVSAGPGSYTGLRIGVSTAKGLCYGLGVPLIAVGSLESLAWQVDVKEGILCPMIDARRMEVYTQLFDPARRPLTEVSAEVITADRTGFGEMRNPPSCHSEEPRRGDVESPNRSSLTPDETPRPLTRALSDGIAHIFGSGAAKCREVLPWAHYIDVHASARGLAVPASRALAEGRFVDVAYFEPLYLKDFVATTPKKK